MSNYKVFMTGSAASDLQNISNYISKNLKEPETALKTMNKIKVVTMGLEYMPHRHELVSDERLYTQGIRKIIVDNYIIFYIISEIDKRVIIVRMLYGRRDWINIL